MRNNILNLKEEILRIKSLFTEERMFGNLVEDDPGCQCDDPKKEKYGKYNPTTSQCDPKLCEDADKSDDTDKNKTSEEKDAQGFIELTDSKKKEIENDETDSLDFYEQKVISGKTYIKRNPFSDIKIKLGSVDKPKAGRDMYFIKKRIKNDEGVAVEIYITKDADLKYMSKKDGKGIRKDIKRDVKNDKKDISNNIDSCKEHLKSMYKAWLKGAGPGDLEEYGFESDAYLTVERCMANFYNRFEDNEKIMTMVSSFKEKKYIKDYRGGEDSVEKGVEGQKYEVKDVRGRVIGKIKKITGNQFKFNGDRGYTFMQKKVNPQTGDVKITFRQTALDSIYKTLNLKPSEHDITIMKADNDLNDCTFRVEPK
jgi:hypothetical protein